MPTSDRVLAIVGPTATGKSAWAIELARALGGEVLSADSRQVYRGMDLGTGKVVGTPDAEVAGMVPLLSEGIRHWLLDLVDPTEDFTVANYQERCRTVLQHVEVPILCGGTGLYVRAILEGLTLPSAPPDAVVRSWDLERLQTRLRELDPAAAVDWKNPRRLMRAVEIVQYTGQPLAASRRVTPPAFEKLVIGVDMDIEQIRRRIHVRLLERLQQGMVGEVQGLLDRGVPWERLEGFGLEYRYVTRHLRGDLDYQDMLVHLEAAIGQYARRQLTWFRKYGDVHWVATPTAALELARAFVG